MNVCVREERERDRKTPSDVFTGPLIYCASAFLVCVCVCTHEQAKCWIYTSMCLCVCMYRHYLHFTALLCYATQAGNMIALVQFVLSFHQIDLLMLPIQKSKVWSAVLCCCKIFEVSSWSVLLLHLVHLPVCDMRHSPAVSADILIQAHLKAQFSHCYLLQS